MSETTTTRTRRADAVRNRGRLVEMADDVFQKQGPDASLEAIARQAGVGIGTLYRHFPTRQALQEAVFLRHAEQLEEAADRLQAEQGPLEALVSWLRLQAQFAALGRNLGAAVMNAKHQEGSEIQVTCARMWGGGDRLLERAKQAGAVRADVELRDIIRLLHGIVLVLASGEPDRAQAERMFELVVTGLRP